MQGVLKEYLSELKARREGKDLLVEGRLWSNEFTIETKKHWKLLVMRGKGRNIGEYKEGRWVGGGGLEEVGWRRRVGVANEVTRLGGLEEEGRREGVRG